MAGIVGWGVIILGGIAALYGLSNRKWGTFFFGIVIAILGTFLAGFVQI